MNGINPEVVFLCETKADEICMEEVMNSLRFFDMVIIYAKGRAEDLCMMWRNTMNVEVLEYNINMIAIKIKDLVNNWYLVGFYGPPYEDKNWENLSALLESLQGSWIYFGDFNIVPRDNEKAVGRKGSSLTPNYLRDILFS